MSKQDDKTTLEDLKQQVRKFRDDRDWNKHHQPKNLAISIAIEAGELLEHFQWDNLPTGDRESMEHELADIIIYCLFFADQTNVDIASAVKRKLDIINKKYPADLFKGKGDAADIHKKIKHSHRQKK